MKTVKEMMDNVDYESEVRTKIASMDKALKAGDPDTLLKIAADIKPAEYDRFTPAALMKLGDLYAKANEMKKSAEESPGNPTGLSPQEHDAPAEEKTTQTEGSLPEGATDPQINLDGAPAAGAPPGAVPEDAPKPIDITNADKKAFVLESIQNGILRGTNVLVKAAAVKRGRRLNGERRVKQAEVLIQGLIDTHGEENVAEILKEAASLGTQKAMNILNGGSNG